MLEAWRGRCAIAGSSTMVSDFHSTLLFQQMLEKVKRERQSSIGLRPCTHQASCMQVSKIQSVFKICVPWKDVTSLV